MMHIVLELMGRESYLGITETNNSDKSGNGKMEIYIIGFAFDTKAKLFAVSVNGNYDSPNG